MGVILRIQQEIEKRRQEGQTVCFQYQMQQLLVQSCSSFLMGS